MLYEPHAIAWRLMGWQQPLLDRSRDDRDGFNLHRGEPIHVRPNQPALNLAENDPRVDGLVGPGDMAIGHDESNDRQNCQDV